MSTTDSTAAAPRTDTRRARRAALASFLGGALEYYDFFIYATAASLMFNHIFFPAGDPTVALIQSFAIFGVGYVFRPLGAFVFGHLGDRIGRKNTLVLTLVLMGSATCLIGVLPTFGTAGYWAPILLTVLRILQGLSAGGETAGGSTLTVEESPVGRRSFFTSFTSSGINAGIVLASLVFIPIAALPAEARDAWGWRLPFLLSVVVLIVAYLVRRRLEEPEVFQAEQEEHQTAKLPVLTMFRTHAFPFLHVAIMSLVIVTNTFMQSFGLAFATQIATINATAMLWASVAANTIAVLLQPLFGMLADTIGRRKVFITSILGTGAAIFFYFQALATSNTVQMFVLTCLITGGTYAMANAVYPSWFAEQFNVKVRYTGLAIGLQIGILVAGFSPAIGTALVHGDVTNWMPAALIVVISSGVALVGALLAKETYRTPLKELGPHPKI